jgi:hypothetical protein
MRVRSSFGGAERERIDVEKRVHKVKDYNAIELLLDGIECAKCNNEKFCMVFSCELRRIA